MNATAETLLNRIERREAPVGDGQSSIPDVAAADVARLLEVPGPGLGGHCQVAVG